jgi:hypothetical protein
MASRPHRIPLWLKLAVSLFVVVWVPAYWAHYGPQNFFWLCDIAVFMALYGLWRESPLWLSAAAAGVLLVQVGFAVDLSHRLVLGRHLIGGTEYMFDPANPLGVRLLSLYHLALPPVLLPAVWRVGYDRRGFWLMTAIIWVALVPSFFFFAWDNVNMVVRPFEREQRVVAPELYFASLFLVYPLLIFLPAHALLRWAFPPPPGTAPSAAATSSAA